MPPKNGKNSLTESIQVNAWRAKGEKDQGAKRDCRQGIVVGVFIADHLQQIHAKIPSVAPMIAPLINSEISI